MLSLQSIPPAHQRLLEAFLARRSAHTRRAYEAGLRAYAAWLGTTPQFAASHLLRCGQVGAAAEVLSWVEQMAREGKGGATIAARINALKALVAVARLSGLCDWGLDVPSPSGLSYRDTRGPGRARVLELIQAAGQQDPPERAARDVAMLRLLYDLGLRCSEVVRLRVEDVAGRRLMVQAKGSLDKDPVTLPQGTAAALEAWLTWRGRHPGPLFHRLDRAGLEEVPALTARGIHFVVSRLGRGLGFKAWPHGLRHSAVTDALDAGFDLRSVFRFGRWRGNLSIITRYDDNRQDLGAAVADRLAAVGS